MITPRRNPRLMTLFDAELAESERQLEEHGVALAEGSGAGALEAAMRVMHTVKGNCYLMGFEGMGDLVHAVEAALEDGPASRAAGRVVLGLQLELRRMFGADPTAPLAEGVVERLTTPLDDGAPPPDDFGVAAATQEATDSVRVPIAELGELLALVTAARRELASPDPPRQVLDVQLGELARRLVSARKGRLSATVPRLKRLVLETSVGLGKQVALHVRGADTEIDLPVQADLATILPHLLRNALDHGLEAPDERVSAGKSAEGSLSIDVRDTGHALRIFVRDDGRGIETSEVVERALARGVATSREIAEMTHYERLRLIFTPGFSTRSEASRTSGRGVGLDIVESLARARGGRVEIATTPGQGTTFELTFPLDHTGVDLLLARLGDRVIGLPTSAVLEVVPEADGVAEEAGLLQWDGRLVPVIGVPDLDARFASETPRPWLLLDSGQEERGLPLGMGVDALLGLERVLLAPWPTRPPAHLSGLGRLRDGTVVWGLDAEHLARNWNSYTVPDGM